MNEDRQVSVLLAVISSVQRQVFMHNHRISIYRPIIDAFSRAGLGRNTIKNRCMGHDPAFDDALRAGPQDIIRGGAR